MGGEVSGAQLWQVFQDEYLPSGSADAQWGRYALGSVSTETDEDGTMTLTAALKVDGNQVRRTGTGNGPIAALLSILREDGVDVRVLDYSEHALSEGGSAQAAAYVECAVGERVLWGVGIDANTQHGLAQGRHLGREPRHPGRPRLNRPLHWYTKRTAPPELSGGAVFCLAFTSAVLPMPCFRKDSAKINRGPTILLCRARLP